MLNCCQLATGQPRLSIERICPDNDLLMLAGKSVFLDCLGSFYGLEQFSAYVGRYF